MLLLQVTLSGCTGFFFLDKYKHQRKTAPETTEETADAGNSEVNDEKEGGFFKEKLTIDNLTFGLISSDTIQYQGSFSEAQKTQVSNAYQQARKRMPAIFEDYPISTPKITICHSNDCNPGIIDSRLRQHIAFTDNMENEILSAWIFKEIPARMDKLRESQIPYWFRHGLAAIASDDARYKNTDYHSFHLIARLQGFNVRQLKSATEWSRATNKIILNTRRADLPAIYLLAAGDVSTWYANRKGFPVVRILFEVNHGADFDLIYQNIADLYGKVKF